ncbi:MAG: sodium-translocating pyrophosphatase [Candidatus Diapherotrites archaeon]
MFALILVSAIVSIIALISVFGFNRYVSKQDPGTEKMQQLQKYIREGAWTFMVEEMKVFVVVLVLIALILWGLFYWEVAAAFLIGGTVAMSAGFIGMHGATMANARVTSAARKDSKKALNIALAGGSINGMAAAGLAVAGLTFVIFLFAKEFDPSTLHIETKAVPIVSDILGRGLTFIKAALIVSAYSMGASLVALFDRVGGGIYTKAADMGADLVGKAEKHLPEDDPRNPATIADNVGDNVGDVGGLGADLLESFVGAIISVIVILLYVYVGRGNESIQFILQKIGLGAEISLGAFWTTLLMPLLIVSGGIIASILGILFVLSRKSKEESLQSALTNGARISAFLTIVFAGIILLILSPSNFNLFWTIVVGVIAGVIIGFVSEYYTSSDFKPVKELTKSVATGPAIGVTHGMAVGMTSTFVPGIVVAVSIVLCYSLAGLLGIAYGAMGMLSFVGMNVSIDSYGPIADNAGGIAQGSNLPKDVRKRTDKLDAIGNTTAAIGKGFAIGSAAFAALALIVAFLWSAISSAVEVTVPQITVLSADPKFGGAVMAAMFLGAMIPYVFSALLIRAVSDTADKMIHEIRRQFKEKPGILKGTQEADFNKCISITSKSALKKLVLPIAFALILPFAVGFILGRFALAGFLLATLLSCMQLAIYCGNMGGALDNAKKYIEEGHYGGKGSEAHVSSVVGDTVGDPLKDTVGPSLDILVKLMAVISILFASLFPVFPIFA